MPDKIRVLAVDDMKMNLTVIGACLRDGDFELTATTDALEALRMFRERFFDVVLLDVIMPGISGFELRKLMREVDAERPIIFFTSMVDDASMTMLNQIAWDPHTFYLHKGIDKSTLVAKIEEACRAHRLRIRDRIRSSKLEDELHIAGNLQKMLLPPWCEVRPEMIFGAAYVPVLQTSGDIFDVIALSPGRYLFFVADISGHGISAALYMTAILTYLRMLPGLADMEVHEILHALNQFACREFRNNMYLTALAVRVDFTANHLSLHSAGHPPLLRCTPSEKKIDVLADSSGSIPLGWFADSVYSASGNLECDFRDGDVFLAMTDGILDMEDEDGRSVGAVEFRELVEAVGEDADAVILPNRILEVMNRIGYSRQGDDIAILAFQKRQPGWMEMTIPARLTSVQSVSTAFASLSEDIQVQVRIELCLDEHLNNVILHGHRGRSGDSPIYAGIRAEGDTFRIRIVDSGTPWNLTEQTFASEAPDPMAISGRGMQILQTITESISYESSAGLNEAVFVLKKA